MKVNKLLINMALIGVGFTAANIAVAQTANVPFGGLKHDNSLPVEITADKLSINQKAGSAMFEGNVLVGQGSMRLSAIKMSAFYASDGTNTGKIDRIEATGGVVLSNGSEAAEADKATYNVEAGTITMSGNVILTQGQNAISGNKFTINLNSGAGEMTGRVRTIFQPTKK